ncbi:hypothetical protein CsatB_008373 [Cannabis sativa]
MKIVSFPFYSISLPPTKRHLSFSLISKWNVSIENVPLHNGVEVVNWFLNLMSAMDDVSMIYQEEFLLFAAILFHNLWFFKNDIYHNNSQWSFLERKKKINCNFKGHWNTMIRNREGRTDGARSLLTRWTLPRPGRIRVNVDFVNKEGTRAVGVVVRNDRGSILALFAIKISFLSIVHGELMATFWGLKVLQQMGCMATNLYSDCQPFMSLSLLLLIPIGI